MSIALFLGGGAPNLAFMAGGLYEMETRGVEYSLVSTTGAGMLVGLLYAAPAGEGTLRERRLRALHNTLDMYVDDRIYGMMERFFAFPANYKVFHKSGPLAELYTRLSKAIPRPVMPSADLQRLYDDWFELMLSVGCPTDLSPWSKGMCQPAPFIRDVIDFDALKEFSGEFVINAYCLENRSIELFKKNEITAEHFQAALACPFIYSPYKLNGKTYIEGSVVNMICFEPVFDYLYAAGDGSTIERTWTGRPVPSHYRLRPERPKVDTLLVFNVLGHEQLIREPRQLLDALAQEIVAPLVPLSKNEIRIFQREHLPRYQKTNPNLDLLEVRVDLREEEWTNALDWSRSNGERLFERGREAAAALVDAHPERFRARPARETLLVPDVCAWDRFGREHDAQARYAA